VTVHGGMSVVLVSKRGAYWVGVVCLAVFCWGGLALAESDPQAEDVTRQRNLLEVGGYLGLAVPSTRHELVGSGSTHQEFAPVVAQIGARLSFMPLYVIGVEAEGTLGPTSTKNSKFAMLYAVRAHAIAQYPVWRRLCLFGLLGGGILGVASDQDAVGRAVDGAFHWGWGAKYYWPEKWAFRADFRHVISDGIGLEHAQQFEFLFGAAWVIGWHSDRDRDGVADDKDRCPDKAAATSDGCPDTDMDRDGVPDDRDRCPARRGVAADGCPPKDEDVDGDGIVDSRDRCPRKPETVNGFEDEDGCPDDAQDPIREFNEAAKGPANFSLTFALGKAKLTEEGEAVVDSAAAVLVQYPRLSMLVRGHTDASGNRRKNVVLSRRRAVAVKQRLVTGGVLATRITVEGVGPSEPIADNKTKEGRAKNRRIEFRALLEPQEAGGGKQKPSKKKPAQPAATAPKPAPPR
jgi:OOP family OmpA-OmpF porin